MNKFAVIIATLLLTFSLTSADADDGAANVVLINTFKVPVEAVDEAIAMWEIARDFLKTQPGYVSTKLHRSLSPDARYLLINVAEWESPDAFKAATSLMRLEAALPRIEGVVPGPGLYKVIRQ